MLFLYTRRPPASEILSILNLEYIFIKIFPQLVKNILLNFKTVEYLYSYLELKK